MTLPNGVPMPCMRRAEEDQHALGRDQADAPGGDDRVDRPVVEPPDDQPLERHADEPGGERARGDGERQRQAGARGEDGGVGAAHDELAMREVDDAHHAEDHREPGRRDHQEREGVAELVEELEGGRTPSAASCVGERETAVRPSPVRRDQLAGGGSDGVYCADGSFLVRSQPASPSQ